MYIQNMGCVIINEITCKYCNSNDIVKCGKYSNVQYLYYKKCQRKFTELDALHDIEEIVKLTNEL